MLPVNLLALPRSCATAMYDGYCVEVSTKIVRKTRPAPSPTRKPNTY